MMRPFIEEVLLGEGINIAFLVLFLQLVHLPLSILALTLLVKSVFLRPVGPLGLLMGLLLLAVADLLVALLSLLLQLALDLMLALQHLFVIDLIPRLFRLLVFFMGRWPVWVFRFLAEELGD